MTNETISQRASHAVDFKLFEATPGKRVVFLPDSPRFTIIAASEDMCRFLLLPKEQFLGQSVFDAFPANPSDPEFTGHKNLKASLDYVVQHKLPHKMERQRYDVAIEGRSFNETYWQNNSTPVLNDEGEVSFIIHTAEDITEQVKTGEMKEKIKGMEQAYNLLLHAPVSIAILRGEKNIVELANASALRLWNQKDDVIGKPLSEVYPEIDGQVIFGLLDNVRKTGKPYLAYEVPSVIYRTEKKEIGYFDVVYQPFYDDYTNKVSGVFTLSHDVTDLVLGRHKIEEAKKEAEKQKRLYETINGSTPDLIYVFDLNYRFTYINKALLVMWGKTWEQSIGKRLLENGYEAWHAEMHEREIDEVVATKMPVRGEVSFPHAIFGRRVYDYILVPVFNEKGEVEAVAGTTRDITELKEAELNIRESEQRFRNLADESPMFVFIIEPGPEAPVTYWNKTWLQYTGQSMEEAVGRAWDGIIHPDDVQVVMDNYAPAFENRQAYFIPSVRVKRYDGEYRWHAFKGNPRYSHKGDFNGYVGVGFDIHEQKLGEEIIKQSEAQLQIKVAERTDELRITIEELRRSNANLEEFAYAASHDLKEPIRKIHFFSDRLKIGLRERLSEEEKNAFERMESASKRMSSLIDDLLAYSQVSLRPRSFENVGLNQLINLVLEDLDLEIEEKRATIKVDNLFAIQGHHRQLQQAFQNLISNSLKYSKPGVPTLIEISCNKKTGSDIRGNLSAADQRKNFYVISIKDNGIGFDPNDADRIFNVFTRLHGNTEFRGTGIGLSIVRKVIENHNGFITAEGHPGEGATFKIYLPV